MASILKFLLFFFNIVDFDIRGVAQQQFKLFALLGLVEDQLEFVALHHVVVKEQLFGVVGDLLDVRGWEDWVDDDFEGVLEHSGDKAAQ